jgi:hypothetical protein|tara:strand:+ start:945 stop:1109 length:165 start_codon:yes stop_codon:yes gene_type:complete
MSAAQKERWRRKQASSPATISPVDAIIYARKLVNATNGDAKMAAKIVETIGSTS